MIIYDLRDAIQTQFIHFAIYFMEISLQHTLNFQLFHRNHLAYKIEMVTKECEH